MALKGGMWRVGHLKKRQNTAPRLEDIHKVHHAELLSCRLTDSRHLNKGKHSHANGI